MKLRPRHLSFALLGAVFGLVISSAPTTSAQGIDWSAANWQAGVLSQNVAIGGNNALFAITGDTGQFQSVGGVATPSVGNYGTTAPASTTYANGGTGLPALQLFVNHTVNSQSVTLTVTFDTPVPVIGFFLFDVDLGTAGTTTGGVTTYSYVDQISNIQASADGTNYAIAPTLTASTGTIVGNNTVGNSVYGTVSSTNNLATSNVGISFNNPGGIKSFQFTYGNHLTGGTSTTQTDPGQQIIGIGNITVPEPGTVACSVAGLLLVGFVLRRQRRLSSL